MDRYQILTAAMSAGTVYALARVIIAVFYPTVAGYVWQTLIGPGLIRKFPDAAQQKDEARYSYMALDHKAPYVFKWGFFPAPVTDMSQGLRDGMLLGAGMAMYPELVSMFFIVIFFTTCVRNYHRVANAKGAEFTDKMFMAGEDLTMFMAIIISVHAARLLPAMQ